MSNQNSRSRFAEFDIGRAIAILGLPVVHVLEEGDLVGVFEPGFLDGHVFLLALSAFGAPMFMACMGANMVFTRHATPAELARRGIGLLIMGAMLNIARYGVPDVLFTVACTGTYANADWWLSDLVASDIYDFSGLCFLCFALFKKVGASARQIVVVAVACLVAGAYVLPYFFANPDDTLVTRALGRLFWVNEFSCFPLLTWMIFPALGYAFGIWFKRADSDVARWAGLKRMMPTAAIVFVATVVVVTFGGEDALLVYASPANDSITDIPNVLLITSTLVFAAALVHKLERWLEGTRVLAWFVRVSKGIIPYYTCQWVIIGWLETAVNDMNLQAYVQLNEAGFWVVSALIILVSLQVSKGWMAFKAYIRDKKAAAKSAQ